MNMEDKKERIRREEERLKEYFKGLPKNYFETASGLIQNCAFMRVTLEDLQDEILNHGTSEVYIHGANQKGIKASASLQAYQGTMKIYTSAIGKLIRMLPKEIEQKDNIRDEIFSMLDEMSS